MRSSLPWRWSPRPRRGARRSDRAARRAKRCASATLSKKNDRRRRGSRRRRRGRRRRRRGSAPPCRARRSAPARPRSWPAARRNVPRACSPCTSSGPATPSGTCAAPIGFSMLPRICSVGSAPAPTSGKRAPVCLLEPRAALRARPRRCSPAVNRGTSVERPAAVRSQVSVRHQSARPSTSAQQWPSGASAVDQRRARASTRRGRRRTRRCEARNRRGREARRCRGSRPARKRRTAVTACSAPRRAQRLAEHGLDRGDRHASARCPARCASAVGFAAVERPRLPLADGRDRADGPPHHSRRAAPSRSARAIAVPALLARPTARRIERASPHPTHRGRARARRAPRAVSSRSRAPETPRPRPATKPLRAGVERHGDPWPAVRRRSQAAGALEAERRLEAQLLGAAGEEHVGAPGCESGPRA